MTADIQPITERRPVDSLSDRELLVEILDRLRQLDEAMTGLFGAYATGGTRGFRMAARNFAARPDPDGSRAAFLAAGLAELEAHRDR